MDCKVIKEYKNGSKIVEVTTTIITRMKVSKGVEGAEISNKKTVDNELFNDDFWNMIEKVIE